MRILRFITITPAFPAVAAVCMAATTQATTGKLTPAAPATQQTCVASVHDHSAVCITPASPQETQALLRLHGMEVGLSMRTDTTCYALRAYRFSGEAGKAGTFNLEQKPEVSDCQSAAILRQLPAK